jgi:hypothetical protein
MIERDDDGWWPVAVSIVVDGCGADTDTLSDLCCCSGLATHSSLLLIRPCCDGQAA